MIAFSSHRRHEDTRIGILISDVATLKLQMEEHAKITMQIRDILASFKIIGKIAKWMTAVITACGAVYAAIKGVRA